MTETADERYKLKIQSAWGKYEEADLSDAKKLCELIKEEFPDKLDASYLLGIIYFDEHQYVNSVKELKNSLRNDNEKKAGGFINYWLGRNYGDDIPFDSENPLIDKDSSRKFFEKALEYGSYPEDTIYQLRYIYKNNYKKIQLFKVAVKKFPLNLDFILMLSEAYFKVGDFENKEKLLFSVKGKFNSTHLYYELSKIESVKSNFKQSYELINLARKFNDNSKSEFVLQLELGNVFFADGNIEKAKESYIDSFNKEKNADEFWFGMIGVLMCVDNSSFQDFTSLINKMEITKQFVSEDFYGHLPIYFDSSVFVGINLPFKEKDAIKKLNIIKKTQSDEDTLGKIELLKCSLHKIVGDDVQRLKAVKASMKYLNVYHYEFILTELSEAYCDVFDSLVEKNKSIDSLINELISALEDEYSFRKVFLEYLSSFVNQLHKNKKYNLVIDLYEKFSKEQIDQAGIWFEVGFAFNELGRLKKAKYAYDKCIFVQGETSANLNNLANIYKNEGELDKAIGMYKKALSLESDDDLVKNNLSNALIKKNKITKEEQRESARNKIFLNAVGLLKSENFFTLESLYNFLINCKREDDFNDWVLPIQDEMFPVLINTNAKKALDLKENWISKKYILQGEETDEYDISFFYINPYIDEEVNRLRSISSEMHLPQEWLTGLDNISMYQLNELNYSVTSKRINKVNKKYRPLIIRDYNELIFNYLVGNRKSTIVLSGSFVELILTYYCERKKVRRIEYTNTHGRIVSKDLYSCVLFDLISFIDERKDFGNDFYPLTNLSRVYRNFIHPGVELKNSLDKTKSDLCFISSIEILRKVI